MSEIENYVINDVRPLQINNNDLVTVSFYASKPSPNDWIGAYSPAPEINQIFNTVPVKYGYCTSGYQSTYLMDGNGELQFNLTNLRSNVSFYYFTGGFYYPAIFNETKFVAMSTLNVTFQDPNQPLRNRVVPTGDYNVYNVVWSAAYNEIPTLKWGVTNGTYIYSSLATASTVEKSSMCSAPANSTGWRELGTIYTAPLTGILDLNLAHSYIYYVFGDAATDNWSSEFAFWVPAGPTQVSSSMDITTRVVMLADAGVGSNGLSSQTLTWQDTGEAAFNTTQSIARQIENSLVDAIVFPGDLSYANGYLANWDFFMNMMAPVAGSRLVLSQVGNHESDSLNSTSISGYGTASGGECSVVSFAMFPQPTPATVKEPWYSYDVGLIHFLAMSTEHNFTIGSPQYHFILQDLQNVDRSLTPWIVFIGHRPFYVDSSWCCNNPADDQSSCPALCDIGSDVGVMQQLQANIEPLLHKYGVQLGVQGHFHNIQRQAAVYQGQVVQSATIVSNEYGESVALHTNPGATVWTLIGTAGQTPVLPSKMYPWSELVVNSTNGYAVVQALNSSFLLWTVINSADDSVVDRMLIFQGTIPDTIDDDDDVSPALPAGDIAGIVLGTLGFVGIVLAIGIYYASIKSWCLNRTFRPNESIDVGGTMMSPLASHSQFREPGVHKI